MSVHVEWGPCTCDEIAHIGSAELQRNVVRVETEAAALEAFKQLAAVVWCGSQGDCVAPRALGRRWCRWHDPSGRRYLAICLRGEKHLSCQHLTASPT